MNGDWKIKVLYKIHIYKKDILFSLNAKHKQEGEPTRLSVGMDVVPRSKYI